MQADEYSDNAALPVQVEAVLSLADVAARLPSPDPEARKWLARHELIRSLAGQQVVIWEDVLTVLRSRSPVDSAPPRRPGPPPVAREVVSEGRAARALPWPHEEAVTWLRREGLSAPVDGRRVVVWDRVLARLNVLARLDAGASPQSRTELLQVAAEDVSAASAVEEIRDLLREVVDSDAVQGILALRGRKTLVRLLLGVVPTHVAASVLPGTDGANAETLRRLGLVSAKLGNRGGVVVLDRLRHALVGDQPSTNVKLSGGKGGPGGLKRSALFG